MKESDATEAEYNLKSPPCGVAEYWKPPFSIRGSLVTSVPWYAELASLALVLSQVFFTPLCSDLSFLLSYSSSSLPQVPSPFCAKNLTFKSQLHFLHFSVKFHFIFNATTLHIFSGVTEACLVCFSGHCQVLLQTELKPICCSLY